MILCYKIITYRVICPALWFLGSLESCSVLILLLPLSRHVDIVHILYVYFPNFGGFNEMNKYMYASLKYLTMGLLLDT